MAAKSRKTTKRGAKPKESGKRPARAKKSAAPRKPAKAKKPAKKPAKKQGTLRGPKGRSGGGGVTLKGLTFTDSSTGPIKAAPTRVLCNAWTGPQMTQLAQIGQTQQLDFLGGLESPSYQDFAVPFENVPLNALGVILIKKGSPAMPYQPYPFWCDSPPENATLTVTLNANMSITVDLH